MSVIFSAPCDVTDQVQFGLHVAHKSHTNTHTHREREREREREKRH